MPAKYWSLLAPQIVSLRSIFQLGYNLTKAGVMLFDIRPAEGRQLELGLEDDDPTRDRDRLIQALDAIHRVRRRPALLLRSWFLCRPCADTTALYREY